ncbi:ATP-binding protein [Streptomyces dioscori]|uniref:histidine kinase n=1 Tax=Streptomyces dioscori TaxID=2109333 RepID=A0A2P8Q098_9ACTN|nr:ATP-binding protein [Streptomyces dioscori]PSM39671.1 ATP-binding protein [Streptomyces dioscori]
MSHLRAPAARADRREGGRHGRPVARTTPTLPETHIRPQLLRLAILPPLAVALSASAAVLFTVRTTGARPGLTLWIVLSGALAVAVAGIVIATVAADRAARSVRDRIGTLRRISARGQADLLSLVEALRRGDGPPVRRPRARPAADADDFDLLAEDLASAHDGAIGAVVQASQLSSHAGSEQKVEVFVNLARRLQSLVHREISILDELENEIEDPDLLKGLFHVDHLATRIRRHAENLAVLGGAVSRRQWSNPVSMTEVLRSATAEVEQYSRVKLVPPIDGTVRGHAVADVIHLLAELVENATVFSAPHTQVLLRANVVTSGLAVEVEDRGLGMPLAEQHKMNALLADPDQVNVASLLQDGRIGLFVVSQLARRHGIAVRLQTNIYGGVQAVLVVPQALLGDEEGARSGARVVAPAGVNESPVREVAAHGGPAHEGSAHGVSTHATPAHERSAYGTPAHGTPTHGTPAHGMPTHGTPAHGGPAHGTPAHDAWTAVPVQASAHAQSRPDGTPGGLTVVNGGGEGGPAPLPVRGAESRANPAEAVPGIRPDDRQAVAENTVAPPTPRNGVVRGSMSRPQLPRRRAQEHIVPELRGGPAPRQESEFLVGHDPGLMAAFQRGIGLAEARCREMDSMGPTHMGPTHMGPTHMGQAHVEPPPMEPPPMEPAPIEAAPMESARHDGSAPAG